MTDTETRQSRALSKSSVFEAVGYEPHRGQRLIHASRARMKVVDAGRRLGKSALGGHELTPEALYTYAIQEDLKESGHRREFWIVGPEYSDSEKEFRVVWDDLTKLEVPFDRPGSYNSPWSGEMSISCFNGLFQVHAKSAKYPDTLVGEGLSGVILAEAAKLKERVWTKFIRPTLADFRGWAILSSTPEGKNWFYDAWQRGQDPNDVSWASWRMPAWINDHVYPKGATRRGIEMLREAMADKVVGLKPAIEKRSGVDEEIIDLMKDMTEERFAQEIEAKFTEFVGHVFKGWDEEIHVKDLKYNPEWPMYLAVDYGYTNPFVALLIQTDVFDNVYVIAEYRRIGRDITEIADDLLTERGGLFRVPKLLYPDPASPGDSAVLEKVLGVKCAASPITNKKVTTGGDLKWRLDLIRTWLKLVPEHGPYDMRKPKLVVDRSCTGLIFEMGEYRYPDSKAEAATKENQATEEKEAPLKKNDHGPEALGRFFRGFFGSPSDRSTGGRAKVNRARVG